jgi:hypothetical protein
LVPEDGAVAASGVASSAELHVGMNAVVDFADWTAGVDGAMIGAESTRHAWTHSILGNGHAAGEEDCVVGVVIAGGIAGRGGQVARHDLVDQFGLDGGVVDRIGGVRRRDGDLGHKSTASDDLIGAAAEVGVVLGQPIHVGAVQHLLVEGRHGGGGGGGGGVEDLCQELAVASAGASGAP